MSLSWTPEQKERAKEEGQALVKVQIQLKHCGGGNYQIVGGFSEDHAMALWLLAVLQDEDLIASALKFLKSTQAAKPTWAEKPTREDVP